MMWRSLFSWWIIALIAITDIAQLPILPVHPVIASGGHERPRGRIERLRERGKEQEGKTESSRRETASERLRETSRAGREKIDLRPKETRKLTESTRQVRERLNGSGSRSPAFEKLRTNEAKRERNVTVLGHHPDYVVASDRLGAKRFEVPMEHWEKLSETEKWNANKKFLDRAISRGTRFYLATPVENVRKGSYYYKELKYLSEKGYKLSNDRKYLDKK